MSYLPCGTYHEYYRQDHSWWRTKFVRGKMIALGLTLFVIFPGLLNNYWLGTLSEVAYTALGALGVQLLIGYCGQITLGHAAFLAVGAYTSALLMLQVNMPYLWTMPIAGLVAGVWSVFFGLPSARVKGFYLIMTTMAAQFITVDLVITQYISQVGGRGQAFSLPPGALKIGPWVIESDISIYYLLITVTVLMTLALANLLRSRVGRAWVAIRDNDIAAQAMGINIVYYKLVAFFVAGFIGGVAGAAGLSRLSAVSPEHFPWFWSLWLVGVILIGGAGSLYGVFFGSLFMVFVMETLKFAMTPLAPIFPQLVMKFLFLKEATFGLAIAVFLIYEPNGLAYRWWQIKNYFNLWPFSY